MPKQVKTGLPPGSVVYIGPSRSNNVSVDVISYGKNTFRQERVKTLSKPTKLTWVNVNGLHDTTLIKKIGEQFAIHPLILEDVVNTEQHPVYADFGDYLLVILKMIYFDADKLRIEHVSIVLGKDIVFSFQEMGGDVFNTIRERLRVQTSTIRSKSVDYLAYSLIDAIIDNYFVVLQTLGDRIEKLEETLLASPNQKHLTLIHQLRRELLFLRKNIWPLREVISNLQRTESKLVKPATKKYVGDLYDHVIQIIDTLEIYREMSSGMFDVHLSLTSNKMNEVMKVLTVIATIFIPLTFIAGVYGMNFRHMPELHLPWFYPALWAVMICIGLGMFLYFKRKGWV